jgi:plastocyanin
MTGVARISMVMCFNHVGEGILRSPAGVTRRYLVPGVMRLAVEGTLLMLFRSSIALAAAGVLLAAVPASAAGNRVAVHDDFYKPRVKTVAKGTRVVWVNVGSSPHTVTTRAFSRALDPGERYARVVKRGFRYHCIYHSDMKGRIVIG